MFKFILGVALLFVPAVVMAGNCHNGACAVRVQKVQTVVAPVQQYVVRQQFVGKAHVVVPQAVVVEEVVQYPQQVVVQQQVVQKVQKVQQVQKVQRVRQPIRRSRFFSLNIQRGRF